MKSAAYPYHASSINEMVHTRIIQFREPLVFKYLSQKKLFQKWWAPLGFKNEVHHFEFREGGLIQFTLFKVDGQSSLHSCTILELIPDQFICWEHNSECEFLVLFILEPYPFGKTKLIMKMKIGSDDYSQYFKELAIVHNEEILDKLVALISPSSP